MRRLRPPGALAQEGFLKACIHCGQCQAVCTHGSIRMVQAFGLDRHTPEIVPSLQPCLLCLQCTQVCPTKALQPVASAKAVRMGKAVMLKDRCLNWIESGTMCMTCYDRCPLRGTGMVLEMGYLPAVGGECVGCGMCEYVCPKRAIVVVADPSGQEGV